jgi:hypothetical protein
VYNKVPKVAVRVQTCSTLSALVSQGRVQGLSWIPEVAALVCVPASRGHTCSPVLGQGRPMTAHGPAGPGHSQHSTHSAAILPYQPNSGLIAPLHIKHGPDTGQQHKDLNRSREKTHARRDKHTLHSLAPPSILNPHVPKHRAQDSALI